MADQALYIGPGGTVLPDGTQSGSELVPHETVCDVPRGEAEASAYWEPVGKSKAKAARVRTPRRPRKAKAKAAAPAAPAAAVTGDTATTGEAGDS